MASIRYSKLPGTNAQLALKNEDAETQETNNFSRMRQFRAEKRKFRKTKTYVLIKIGFVAAILMVFLAITTAQSYFRGDSENVDLRVRRNADEEDVAPWEECDWETTNDTRRVFFIIIWLLLIVWVFIGLAIICDDFFVPSLEIISERLNLTEDVAGATFMAAGSSAPELFTSIAGVSFESDVGVGTIVGSAIFNLLIIIALSAALSKEVLHIDWRPLARDSIFYAVSIFMFIWFAWDAQLLLWECGVLFFAYCVYVAVMFVNKPLMRFLTAIGKCCSKVGPKEDNEMVKIHESNADGESHENQRTFHHEPQLGSRQGSAASKSSAQKEEHSTTGEDNEDEGLTLIPFLPSIPLSIPQKEGRGAVATLKLIGGWVMFCLAFPWSLMFAWTVPNCSKDHLKKYFILSFVLSVLWIAICSFAMVFMVGRAGCSMTIDSFVMGLILVAIGTSVPDALSSVIVARDGFGDMAVSNAIGSNVFDINLGIGLPSVIRILADKGAVIHLIEEDHLKEMQDMYPNNPFIPHVKFGFLLFFVLLVCLTIFALVRFRLSRVVGISFCSMYFVFIIYAIVQEFACDEGFGC